MFGARIAGRTAFFQTLGEIATASCERGTEAEQYSGENCGDEGESQHSAADICFIETWKALRAELLQELDTGIGEKNSGDAAREREDETFRQELAEQTGASCAQRDADGNFALASGVAREEQAGNICAGNQENQSDRSDQHYECGAHIADKHVLKRVELHAPSIIGDGILRCEASGYGVKFGLRLRNGDAGLEQTDGATEMGAARLHALS